MLNKQEIEEYIAELESQKGHSLREFYLLSSLYCIRDHAFGDNMETIPVGYSNASEPLIERDPLVRYGDSEFLIAISGKIPESAWKIMDDLMDTLHVANPRVYESVMRKIRQL